MCSIVSWVLDTILPVLERIAAFEEYWQGFVGFIVNQEMVWPDAGGDAGGPGSDGAMVGNADHKSAARLMTK